MLATEDMRSKKCVTDDALRPFSALSLQQADGHSTPHMLLPALFLAWISRCSQYTDRSGAKPKATGMWKGSNARLVSAGGATSRAVG